MPASPVKLVGRLPGEVSHNGLADLLADLLHDPDKVRVAIVAFDVSEIRNRRADGSSFPYVQVLRIEVLAGKRETDGQKLMIAAATDRTGVGQSLPFDEWATEPTGDDDEDDQ